MDENKLTNLAEETNPDTLKEPNGSAQIINTANDCKYEFKLKIQRDSSDVQGGTMTFTLVDGMGTPNVTHKEGTDTLTQNPTTKEWTWTFGPVNTSGAGPNRTLEFDALYAGDAGKTILTNATYTGTFADGTTTFGPTAVHLEGTNTTKGGCEVTKTPPEVTAVVTASDCSYHFVFTATWKGTDVSGGTLHFTLNNGFADPTNITPAGALSYTKPNGTWTFGALNASTPTRTLEFDAIYTGAAGQDVFAGVPVTFTANYVSGGSTGTITVFPTGTTLTTQQCPIPTNPCCEACDPNATDVAVQPCDDHVEAPVTVAVAPKGKRLSVHLDLPAVCDTKDVNVGVFVTEVFNMGEVNEVEVPFAHKVIRRTATTETGACIDDRDCNCVDFMIDDEDACGATRNFRVRTQAHYVDAASDVPQQCQCSSCSRP